MLQADRYRLEVRFGDELLEAGFTAVPNLLLNNYADLGISDAAAFWIVHLLKFKWTDDNPYPRRSSIPMNANRDTQKRYARHLRSLGLLFTRRMYWSLEDNPPDPRLVGKIRALEYDLSSLFHNVVRISGWKEEGYPLDEFEVEIPLEIMEKVVNGYFHHVPKKWKLYSQWKMAAMESEIQRTDNKADAAQTNGILACEKRTLGPRVLEGENSTIGARVLGSGNNTLASARLPVDHHPVALGVDTQPVEDRPYIQQDTLSNNKHVLLEQHQHYEQQPTQPPDTVVVLPPHQIRALVLGEDEVIVDRTSEGLGPAVMPIGELVRAELSRRKSEAAYRADVYYSVAHALGEGPEDWSDEELAKIRRKATLERELAERWRTLGAFSLEEALREYFTPEFSAKLLSQKSQEEVERIAGWVAYVRRQKNLSSPSGFLRTKIESTETPPTSPPGRILRRI